MSPLAWGNAGSGSLGGNALSDLLNVSGQVSWSAEFVIWDESLTVTPHAVSIAVIFWIVDALSEVSFNSGIVDLDWMAELFGEEWDVSGWTSWLGWVN